MKIPTQVVPAVQAVMNRFMQAGVEPSTFEMAAGSTPKNGFYIDGKRGDVVYSAVCAPSPDSAEPKITSISATGPGFESRYQYYRADEDKSQDPVFHLTHLQVDERTFTPAEREPGKFATRVADGRREKPWNREMVETFARVQGGLQDLQFELPPGEVVPTTCAASPTVVSETSVRDGSVRPAMEAVEERPPQRSEINVFPRPGVHYGSDPGGTGAAYRASFGD